MRKEKGGKRGKKKMDERQEEREKESGVIQQPGEPGSVQLSLTAKKLQLWSL